MKTVILDSMTLVNFKGHKNLTIAFNQETHISGKNATGKSSIADAFSWLLFGKDQFDRKDFEIIPTVNGKLLDRVDSEVYASLGVNGSALDLKRVLRQKWVRRRGTAEEVFDGCETLFYINGVPKKAGEYKAVIDGIIDETLFKLITNPSTFLSLHWTKQREFLFQIAGTISDAQIADQNPNFKLLLDAISGKSFADFKKELSARKNKLKQDLDDISPKIDQTTKLMPESKDFAALELELKKVEEDITKVDLQLSNKAESLRLLYEDSQRKQKHINELKGQQIEIVNNAKQLANQDAFDKNIERDNLLRDIKKAENDLKNAQEQQRVAERALNTLTLQKSAADQLVTKLREDWATENAKEYQEKDGCLTCPVFGHECGDPIASSKHNEAKEAAKTAFFKAKDKKLDAINSEGISKASEIEEISKLIEGAKKDLEDETANVSELELKLSGLNLQLEQTTISQPKEVVAEELSEWKSLQAQIDAINPSVEINNEDNSDLKTQKQQLTEKRDNLKKSIGDKDLIARYSVEIDRLKASGNNLSQQIADIEKQEFLMAEFTKAKIDECEKRINGLFSLVRFKLFDKTIDGNEFECCTATNKNGVPISATNTAEKINAGMDIISVLLEFYNVSAPIFCDGAESVNEYIKIGSQIAFLEVTREPVLTIN